MTREKKLEIKSLSDWFSRSITLLYWGSFKSSSGTYTSRDYIFVHFLDFTLQWLGSDATHLEWQILPQYPIW